MAKTLDYHTIREIFIRFQDAEAEPKGELDHTNVYTLLVAVALSAQATDAGVNKATKSLFEIVEHPQQMLDLGLEGLTEHIKSIGLFRQKAKNVMKLSQLLVELNMWWHYPAQAVDTHIFRVGNRTRIAPGKTVDAVERAIEDNIPVDFQHHAHHWMILHGRYHCKARKPLCRTCIIRDLCPYEEKTE